MQKQNLYATLFLLLFYVTARAQGPDWAMKAGGTLTEQAKAVAVDGAGNIYVTGSFESTGVDFDPGTGNTNFSTAGGSDIFLAKYSPAGALLWVKQIGGSSNDAGEAICIDANDNIWITGYFAGTVDFDPGTGTTNLAGAAGAGRPAAFVAKYTGAGAFLLAKPITGSGSDAMGSGICVNRNNGRICMVGRSNGIVDLDPSATNYLLTSAGGYDVLFAEYNTSGALIAGKIFGGSGNDFGTGIATNASGDYIIAGRFSGTADFDPSGTTNNKTANGPADAFVAKYNTSFVPQWVSAIGGAGDQDFGICVAEDGAGNIITGGYFMGTTDLDPSGNTVNISSAGGNVISGYLVKYTSTGAYTWGFPVASAGYTATVWGLTIGFGGTVYITGYAGSFDADPTAAVYPVNCFQHDAYVAHYSAAGLLSWAVPLRGNSVGNGYGIAVDLSGNVTLAGNFADTVDINPGPNVNPLVSVGQSFDALLVRLKPCNIPLAPTVTNDTVCRGNSTVLSAQGGNISWYYAAEGNNYAGPDNLVISNVQNPLTFWAQDSGCVGSPRTLKQIAVAERPDVEAYTTTPTVCAGQPATLWADGADGYGWSTQETTDTIQPTPVSPSETFTVIGTSLQGCTDTAAVTITVNPLPIAEISPADTTICADTALTLTAVAYNPANNYQWGTGDTTGQVTLTVTTNTTFYLTVEDANGCLNYDSTTLTIDTLNLTISQSGASLTSNHANAADYQWINCNTGAAINNATSANYTATANGNYAVVVYTNSGCADTSECVNVTGVGISGAEHLSMQVSPNPFNQYIQVLLPNTEGSVEAELFTVDGRLIKKISLQPSNTVINTADLQSGIYFLKVHTHQLTYESKLVK